MQEILKLFFIGLFILLISIFVFQKFFRTNLSAESKKVLGEFELFQKEAAKLKIDSEFFKRRRPLANQFLIDLSGAAEPVAGIENSTISSYIDNYAIPVRLYKPSVCSDKIFLFIHGGGKIHGNLDTHDYLCRKITNIFNIQVIAVDYRLAPEHRFPVLLEDIFSVYQHISEKYSKVYVAGDSAGGNLAAALCIMLHDRGKKLPHAQILMYPLLSNDFKSPSFKKFGDIPVLRSQDVEYIMSLYTGKPCDNSQVVGNKLIYPLLEIDMNAFPRTFLISAACDVLLDGQMEFKKKMNKAKIECRQIILSGALHGFMTYGAFDKEITKILTEVKKWLR